MAQTALSQLQAQIEAVRREAYEAGYAAAMAAIREVAARPAAAAATPAVPPQAVEPTRRGRRLSAKKVMSPAAKAIGRRPRRGTNAQMIAEVLQAIAPRAARPTEIRQALQRDKGIDIAFTSIRHALGQLEARQTVELDDDHKTWRYLGAAAGG
jgi:hypothetical protein